MNFRYIFCCWSVLSGTTEKYLLKPHCCIKTVLWDSHLQGALSISRPFVASVDISVFFLPQTPRLPAPEHTSTESRDVKPLRLALKYSYPLLLKLCLLAGCQQWNLFGTVGWASRVGFGLVFFLKDGLYFFCLFSHPRPQHELGMHLCLHKDFEDNLFPQKAWTRWSYFDYFGSFNEKEKKQEFTGQKTTRNMRLRRE